MEGEEGIVERCLKKVNAGGDDRVYRGGGKLRRLGRNGRCQ